MIIPLFGYPYKVHSRVAGWRGWRLWYYVLHIRQTCECPSIKHHDGEDCECAHRAPHRHTYFGYVDTPLGLP